MDRGRRDGGREGGREGRRQGGLFREVRKLQIERRNLSGISLFRDNDDDYAARSVIIIRRKGEMSSHMFC